MIVVSDTSPINYLVLIGEIDLLPSLYGKVILPQSVFHELTQPKTPKAVRDWISRRPDWIEVRVVEAVSSWSFLDPGEQEAIALALALKADLVLMDERRGRVIAEEEGLKITGVIGILDEASHRGLISLTDGLKKIQETNFRIKDQVIQNLLEREK